MTEQRELRIPYNEVSRIVIECKCSVELTVDMSRQGEAIWKDKGLACPVCHSSFDSNLRNGLYYFSLWFNHAKQSGEKVSFRIIPT